MLKTYVIDILSLSKDYRDCYAGEFRCNNSECKMVAYLCDGQPDCLDGSDEHNCGIFQF